MAMIRWRPFGDIERLFDELKLTDFSNKELATDIYEQNGNVIVDMQIPGINPDTLDISVEGDHLRVIGSREEEKETEGRDYYKKEIRRGDFERIVHLPVQVAQEQAKAEVHNGLLSIMLPKREKEQARKITIEKTKKAK